MHLTASTTSRRWGVLLGLLGAFTAAILFVHRLGTGGDNMDFIMLARSLQHGQWGDILGWPRPPGYSLFIAGVFRAMGLVLRPDLLTFPASAVYVLKMFNVAFYGLMTLATYRVVLGITRRQAPAAAAALLIAVNQTLAAPATFIGNETLFTLLVLLALAAWERAIGTGGRRVDFVMFAVLAFLATQVKYQGVTLAAGLAFWILVHRRWRGAPLACAAVLGVVVLAQVAMQTIGNRFVLDHMVATDPYGSGEHVTIGWRIRTYVETYSSSWADMLLPKMLGSRGLLEMVRAPWLSWPLAIAVTALLILGYAVSARRRFTLAHSYFLAYLGLLLVWPDFLGRYLIPLVPLAAWFAYEGLWPVLQRVASAGAAPRAMAVLVGLLVAWCLAVNAFAGVKNARNIWTLRHEPPWHPERYRISREDDFADYVDAAYWLRAHAPSNVVVYARKALYIELVGERRGAYYSAFDTPADLWRDLLAKSGERPCYILQDVFDPSSTYGRVREKLLAPVVRDHGDALRELYRAPGGSRILEVTPP
jgi:hypothetical protein